MICIQLAFRILALVSCASPIRCVAVFACLLFRCVCPSHRADTDSDYEMKRMLLDDMFNVVDIEGKLTGKEVQVGVIVALWPCGHCDPMVL